MMKAASGKITKIVLLACVSIAFHFSLSTFHTLHAQDIHFSMFDLDPILYNPAYCGFFDGEARFGLIYRNQWASVTTPFQTLGMSAEVGLLHSERLQGGLSAGLTFAADRAGTLNYGTTSAAISLAYYQAIGTGRDLLSFSGEAAYSQSGFNSSAIVLVDATESIGRERVYYATLGAGVAWFREWTDRVFSKVGFSLHNIGEPDISYLGLSDTRLKLRWNVYSRAEWRLTQGWALCPVAAYQRQSHFEELLYGCDVKWYLDERPRHYLAFGAGLLHRYGDALSLNISVDWRSWTFAFCYDANLSRLAQASHTIGAFELGIVYLLRKDASNPHREPIPCPII